MNKKKPIRLEELLNVALAYAKEDTSYQAAVRASPLGRQSDALREEATFVVKQEDVVGAHALYEKAVGLHLPADNSAAAAGARHDLAESYKNRRTGIRVENLLRAQALYREALLSRERDKFPSRAAMTRASLASCLRQLADETYAPERETAHSTEAAALLQEAIGLCERRGAAGWIDTISYLNTLGNLQLQQALFNSAVSTFNRAESLAGRLRALLEVASKDYARVRIPRLPVVQQVALRLYQEHALREHVLHQFLIGAANARIARDQDGDRKHAKRLLSSVVQNAPSAFGDRARIALARLFRIEGDDKAARELLQAVRPTNLSPDSLPGLAHEHELLGQPEAALQLLHESIEEVIEPRKQHTANYPADHLARRAQTAAAVAARIYAKQKDPLTAFLVLERCAGFRYEESLRHFIWRPQDALTRAIWERRWTHATCSGMLETLASQLTYSEPDKQVQILKQISAEYANTEGRKPRHATMAGDRTYFDLLREQIQGATLALDPIQELRRRGQELRALALAIDEVVAARDPAGYESWTQDQYASSDVAVLRLLQQHPDHVLLRFSLREDLLVLCIDLKDGELQARSCSLVLPAKLHPLLQALRRDPLPDQVNYAELTQALATLDISPILPPSGKRRAVLLPSLWASFLPLAALGPPGRTILDHFESVVFMPTTAGLLNRQDAHPPRSGSLLVIPQQTYTKNTTELHNIAFANLQPDDKVLRSEMATSAAVAGHMGDADVLTIYSHGQHESDSGPYLELQDGKLDISFGQERHWHGLERAELWGCQSGVNFPHDPLTPEVDEGFGFDYTLLSYGVRTAIGTLWKVAEIVTAYLVHHYRQQLAQGADAATALSRAQRSWRDDGINRLTDCLAQAVEPTAGVQRFLKDYAAANDCSAASAARLLGAGKPLRDAELRPFLEWFRCPATWGGYRFLGIPEHRPKRAWVSEDERPLTGSEQAELAAIEQAARETITKRATEDDSAPSAEQWNEHDLATAAALGPGDKPTAEQALLVARRYQHRLLGAHDDNVLWGLAWLHEALCEPQLDPSWRAQLSLEAAHLWLELAEGETVSPIDLTWPRAPHPEPLARARQLLSAVPADCAPVDAAAARARLDFLSKLREEPLRDLADWWLIEGPAFALRKQARMQPQKAKIAHEKLLAATAARRSPLDRAVAAAASGLQQVAASAGCFDYGHRRAVTVACKILRAAPHQLPAVVAAVLALAVEHLQHAEELPLAEHPSLGRLDLAQLELRLLASPMNPVVMLNWGALGAPDLVRWFQLNQQLLHCQLPAAAAAVENNVGATLAIMEGRSWGGCRSLDHQVLWRTAGTLGHGYRVLLGSFLGGLAPDKADMRNAAHTIACLQLACDLRLPLLQRAVEFGFTLPNTSSRLQDLWRLPLRREQLLTALRDTALLPGSHERHDPFAQSIAQLLPGELPTDYTAQTVARLLSALAADGNARTAAFAATRLVDSMTTSLRKTWQSLREFEESALKQAAFKGQDFSLGKLFDPRMIIDEWTERLQAMDPGQAVLGFFLGAADSLWGALCWNGGDGVKQKVVSSSPGIANTVRCLLLDLTMASSADQQQPRWNQLTELLQPMLDDLFAEPLATAKLHLSVLAPGAMRALPWLGLYVQGRPLSELVASVTHLPALGRSRHQVPQTADVALKTACWLAPCDPREGQTRFGEAANASLRALDRPAWIVDMASPEQVPLLSALLARGERVECLRLYGLDSPIRPTGTVSGFYCGRGQIFLPLQFPAPLVHCQAAEVWAATCGWSELEFLVREDGDAVPGLAGALLDHGAATVLDLAWPVPDLVKALVYEIHACYRAKLLDHPAVVLALAIVHTRAQLAAWYENRQQFTSIIEAHAWLDRERQQYLQALAPANPGFVAFASIAITDPPGIDEYIGALCEPVHLAAFRFWGS